MARTWFLPGLCLAFALVGCSGTKDMPQTYPATGTVVSKGGLNLGGGMVQFRSKTDTTIAVSGDIQEDGTFTLQTVKGKGKVSGAPEGEYEVIVSPPSAGDHSKAQNRVLPITLPRTYKVEPKEDNRFTLEVGPPRRP